MVTDYRDDRFVEVPVHAFVEHNLALMRDAVEAWAVYNVAMKPFNSKRRQYEDERQMNIT